MVTSSDSSYWRTKHIDHNARSRQRNTSNKVSKGVRKRRLAESESVPSVLLLASRKRPPPHSSQISTFEDVEPKWEHILEGWYYSNECRMPTDEDLHSWKSLIHAPESAIRDWFNRFFASGGVPKRGLKSQNIVMKNGSDAPILETRFSIPGATTGPTAYGQNPDPKHSEPDTRLDITTGSNKIESSHDYPGCLVPNNRLRALIEQTLVNLRVIPCKQKTSTKRNLGRFECTSKCGNTFAKVNEWKKHEEIRQPQEIFFCTKCGNLEKPSSDALFFRKDKMSDHLTKKHSSSLIGKRVPEKLIAPMKVKYITPFTTRCGFCNRSDFLAKSWKKRIEHIKGHFCDSLTMKNWRDWPEDEEIEEGDDDEDVVDGAEGASDSDDDSDDDDEDADGHNNEGDDFDPNFESGGPTHDSDSMFPLNNYPFPSAGSSNLYGATGWPGFFSVLSPTSGNKYSFPKNGPKDVVKRGQGETNPSLVDTQLLPINPVGYFPNRDEASNRLPVLPYCRKELINWKGGSARVWRLQLQQAALPHAMISALRGREMEDEEFGICYQFALKEFTMPNASSFQCERDAFHLLGNKPGLVQYFGSFMTHNEDSSLPPTYNILLEYAESDLDEFFAHKFPPVATADIYNFWDAMLALVVTVRDIHDPIENGNWIGCHFDLKPDNILWVHDCFKIADLGLARFRVRRENASSGRARIGIQGTTVTYVVAAPEIYSAGGRSGCLVSQTYDIWALGCIFFEASIWMTLGREGLDSFRRGKQRIAKHLPGLRQAKVSMEATQYFDAFHDGKDVSSEVKDWQLRLRNSISYTDTLTEKVVGLVDEMLVSDPQQRVTSVELCEKVQNILEREHSKHSLFSNSDIGTSNSLHMLTTSHPARALVKSLSVVLEPSTSVESVGTTTNHQYRDQLENFPSPLEISTRDNFQESCYRLGSQEIANMPKGGQRSPTIKAFLNFLQDYATDGTCGTRNARFIPAMPLKDYLRRNIEDLLRAVSLPNDVHLHRAHDIVESYSQVFAILVSINEGAYIYHFAKKDELSDRRLPFENQKAFPRREDFFDKFYQAQWQFCAPTLTYLFDRSFGKDCILPFKRDGDPIFGDSCSVYRINILPEYDSLCSPDMLDQNPSSIRTLKEFKDHSEFLTEQAAFTTLTKDGHSPEHIVEYLGSYEQGEVRCIILEFADMGSLDDYFHNITPPASERDTVAFFSSLFQLLKGLMSIHEVGENIVGWHQDVKPANILALSQPSDSGYGCLFKISDFVTSHFKLKESSSGVQKSKSISFDRTFTPPECWRNEDTFLQNCNIQVTQTVDIWSLGCVFVEAMVWATFGCHGLEEFRSQRLATTKTIAGFKDGNCFHDGWNRLEIVDDWLDHVVEESQKKARDNISPNLAHLVRLMLDADPKCRPDTKSIYHWTEQYIFKATKKLQQHEGTNASNRLAQPPPNTPPSPPSRPTYSVGGSQDQTRSSYQWQNSPDSSIAIGSSPPTSPVVGSEQRYSQYNNSTTSAGPPNSHNSYQSDYNLALLSHTRPLSDPFDSNNDLSLSSPTSAVGSLSLQRNPISLDTVLERGVQTQKAPIPLWPINDAIFWREQRRGQKGSIHTFSKVFVPDPDKDKFADVDGSKDLQELNARDHILVIDDSYSMKGYKNAVAQMVDLLAYSLKRFDSDGVEMYLSVANQRFKAHDSTRLVEKFRTRSSFRDHCNMAHCLRQIFKDYKDKVKQRGLALKPMNIYILTDAVWQPRCEVKPEIVAFVNFLADWKCELRQVGIQFIRFGSDPEGVLRLQDLDRLKQRGEAVRDIVDEEHYGGNFFKMLLGSINPLFDDDDDDGNINGLSQRSRDS